MAHGQPSNAFVYYAASFITPGVDNEFTALPVVANGTRAMHTVNFANMTTASFFNIQHSNREHSENSGPGLPNYLGSIAVHPAGTSAFIPSKQDNLLGGSIRSNGLLTFDQAVRAVSSEIVLGGAQSRERLVGRIEHDNASVATAAVYGPYGIHLFTALEGNRQVAVSLPENNSEIVRFDVGLAPQGLALSTGGKTLAVHNFMSRTVQFVDISDIVDFGGLSVVALAEVETVATESLGAEVFYGKQLFYDAKDDRLAALDYMSCASCHEDGGDDGRVWDFSQFGEGLRNTITLRGRSGTGHGFLHWTANFDETQDFVVPGQHNLGGLVVEVRAISADSTKRSYSYAQPFASAPLLFSQVVTTNEGSAVTTRHANLSATGFRLEVEEEEAATGGHAEEIVHYVAIQSGSGVLESGDNIASGASGDEVSHGWSTLSFGGSYSNAIFLSAMQTTDGGDTANVRYRNLSSTGVEVTVDEEQSANAETKHTKEIVGWLRLTLP